MYLEIPEPCHENWNAMTPQEKGSFCGKCCKVVIDFTNMATDKVIEFISERKNENVCGRFRPDQIVIPVSQKSNSFSHRAKVFLAALVFVFGGMLFVGCDSNSTGKPIAINNNPVANNNVDSPATKNTVPRDTTSHHDDIIPKGKVKCMNSDTTHSKNQMPLGGPKVVRDEPALMGKVSVPRNDTVK